MVFELGLGCEPFEPLAGQVVRRFSRPHETRFLPRAGEVELTFDQRLHEHFTAQYVHARKGAVEILLERRLQFRGRQAEKIGGPIRQDRIVMAQRRTKLLRWHLEIGSEIDGRASLLGRHAVQDLRDRKSHLAQRLLVQRRTRRVLERHTTAFREEGDCLELIEDVIRRRRAQQVHRHHATLMRTARGHPVRLYECLELLLAVPHSRRIASRAPAA